MSAERTAAASLVPVLTAAEMRDWEGRIFSSGLASERVVMESAGRAVALAVASARPSGRIVAAVGGGNNGGDAVVALRTLAAMGREVVAVPVGREGIAIELAHGWPIPVDGPRAFATAAVIVDGLLGTGATGAPREPQAAAITAMNAVDVPIVAIDGPSGVDLSTGAVPGEAIRAALTVTFGAVKRGLLLHPARGLAGRVLLAEVGFPPLDQRGAMVVTDAWAASKLPSIAPDAYKGSVGLVSVVAGSAGYAGAAIMVSMGALRAGAGGVRVFSGGMNRAVLNTAVPEAVFVERGSDRADALLGGTRAAVIGPGMGTDDETRSYLRNALERFPGPFVLDADALTFIAADPGLVPPAHASRCVLTPHPGELARLLDIDASDVLADRFATAREAAERYDCVVLAKGTPALVAAPGEPTLVNVTGTPGVATAGMGDTLAGIVGAFLAGGAPPRVAAAIGIHFAGRAAESAVRGRGLLHRDVADALPGVLMDAKRSYPTRPGWPFLLDLPAS
jgi:NAD(P)H-hydrate epimerase